MQANLMTENLRAAIARRQSGQPTPAITQQTQPGASLPTGGPNTPAPQPAPAPQMGGTPPPANIPAPAQTPPAQASAAQPSQFDDQTRVAAKVLMSKLLKYM